MKPVSRIALIAGSLFCVSIGCILTSLWFAQHNTNDLRTHIDTLGKTHFIIGQPQQAEPETDIEPEPIALPEVAHTAIPARPHPDVATILTCPTGDIEQALFSPDNDLESLLICLMDNEQEAIKIAVFAFTNGAIANALLRAHERGVKIELIIDTSCLRDRFNKIELLQSKGINPHVYRPSSNTLLSDIMHNKFVIFSKNIGNKPLLWTGSFNFTKSAQLKNQENVVVLDKPHLIDKYCKQFEVIKQRVKKPTQKYAVKKRSPKRTSQNLIHELGAIT